MSEPNAIVYYSPTQVIKHRRCKRKWWFESVAGFKPPQTTAMQGGHVIHDQLERYTKEGLRPSNTRAVDLLNLLKKKLLEVPMLIAERNYRVALSPGRVFVGKIDLTDLSDPLLPTIWDYKSTADLERSAKVDYQLERDVQLNCYAWETLQSVAPLAQRIHVGLLYIQTRGAIKSRMVHTDTPLERRDVEDRWRGYLKQIDQMEIDRTRKDANDVEPNPNACNDYGGCPHRARCNATLFADSIPACDLEGLLRQSLKRETMTEEDLKMITPPDTTRRGPDAPAATPITIDPIDLPSVLKDEVAKGLRLMNPLDKLAGLGSTPAPVESAPVGKLAALLGKQAVQAPMVASDDIDVPDSIFTPPTAPAPKPVPRKEPVRLPDAPAGMQWVEMNGGYTLLPVTAPPPAQEPAPLPDPAPIAPATRKVLDAAPDAPVVTEAPKPKRGRPPKAPALDAPIAVASVAQVPTDPIPESPPIPAPEAPAQGGLHFLFIDCFPVYGFPQGAMRLGQWLAPVLEQIKASTGAAWQFHDFNKAHAVLNQFAQKRPLPNALIVDTGTPESRSLMEWLLGSAKVIFQGAK